MQDETFLELVEPHLHEMVRVARLLVGAEAEDAVQEALLRAWRAWADLRDPTVVRSWLLRIVVNVCYTWQRRGKPYRFVLPLDAALEVPGGLLFDPGTTEHLNVLDLYAVINALNEPLRLVVLLRYFVGLDATEIGVVLHVPSATVRTRLRRSLDLMRQHLGIEEMKVER